MRRLRKELGAARESQRIVAQDCPNALDRPGCLGWCGALTAQPECETAYQAFFACAENAESECNAAGDYHAVGCDAQFGIAMACNLGGPDPALEQPCEDYCTMVIDANCPNSGTLSDCTFGCTLAGADDLGCASEWDTFLTCSEGPNVAMICNDNGDAVPQGCELQLIGYGLCVLAAAGQQNP